MIVGIGPGLLTADSADDVIVINCSGTLVLPTGADLTAPHAGAPPSPPARAQTLPDGR
ncbi:hypothetical protein ACFPC0_01275 [Streptomyces andamanensis]|uniref:Uncharacterized protein n=1 Tax=Streptomyces andamanensis TaxID=1565035 RepID=A0ABV8T630_9ACTN